jgi:hypothetical protein
MRGAIILSAINGTDATDAITNLIHAYAYAVDTGDFDAVSRLFEHGDLRHALGDNEPTTRFRGAALGEFLRRRIITYEEGRPRTRHLITNIGVDVDPGATTATARSYLTTFQQAPGHTLEVIATAKYDDRFERAEAEWRFAERIIRSATSDGQNRDFIGDMSRHSLSALKKKEVEAR